MLADKGLLHIADGLRVQPPSALWELVVTTWDVPVRLVADRFRMPQLLDAMAGATLVEPRVTRWSEAAFDIRSLRALAADGLLVVAEESRLLLAASLSVALMKNDDPDDLVECLDDLVLSRAKDRERPLID